MQNFSAIHPAVRRPFQKNHGGCINPSPPLCGRGLSPYMHSCLVKILKTGMRSWESFWLLQFLLWVKCSGGSRQNVPITTQDITNGSALIGISLSFHFTFTKVINIRLFRNRRRLIFDGSGFGSEKNDLSAPALQPVSKIPSRTRGAQGKLRGHKTFEKCIGKIEQA